MDIFRVAMQRRMNRTSLQHKDPRLPPPWVPSKLSHPPVEPYYKQVLKVVGQKKSAGAELLSKDRTSSVRKSLEKQEANSDLSLAPSGCMTYFSLCVRKDGPDLRAWS
ncbi:hypothetical protein DPSP01_008246 [Paraphaeosphaeria sporulosa]